VRVHVVSLLAQVQSLPMTRTCAGGGQLVISELVRIEPQQYTHQPAAAGAGRVDMALVDNVAVQLGFDAGNLDQVADVAAVAVTRLAWRDGPVEDWHSARFGRINDVEMMRANAATTRAVRAVLASDDIGDVFWGVNEVLSDPRRRLPDGRMVVDLSPSPSEFDEYQAHVAACCERWGAVAAGCGIDVVLALVACRGATFNWKWWRSTGWQRLVDRFIRRLDQPWRSSTPLELFNHRPVRDLPDDLTLQGLRTALITGPDTLTAASASYCLRAGISAVGPLECGLPTARRRLLPPGYLDLVDIPAAAVSLTDKRIPTGR
jgi:hypothetical protein